MSNTHKLGPLEMDTVDNYGEFGSGDEVRSGFKSFGAFDADGHVLFDTLNRDSAISEVHTPDSDEDGHAWDEPAKQDVRRVVACWNALIGVPTDMIEQVAFVAPALVNYRMLQLQRDAWNALVAKAVGVLQRHAPPDGLSDHDALTELYGIFDGPEYRAAVELAGKVHP